MKVSIITVVYNNKDTIQDAIESVLNQTYNNIEYFNPMKEEELINLLNNADKFIFDKNKKNKLLSKYNWNETKRQLQKFYKDYLNEK